MHKLLKYALCALIFACVTLPALAQSQAVKDMRSMMAFCNADEIDLNNVDVATHIVQRGQALGTIARDHAPDGTGGRCLARLNEAVLAQLTIERCDDLQRDANDGYYCNDERANDNYPTWANTLRPGDRIFVPVAAPTNTSIGGTVAREVNIAASKITGNRIVLVVDTSGSMDANDRAKVADLYGQLLGDRVTYVVSYSSATNVVAVTPGTDILSILGDPGDGGTEYVGRALQEAAQVGADDIVLIGDVADNETFNYGGLPRVTTHCLPDPNEVSCAKNFEEIAAATGGEAYGLTN